MEIKTRTKDGREQFIEFSLNYICRLFNDVHWNEWNVDQKLKLVREIFFRLEELKTVFTFNLTDNHSVFVTYCDGLPYLVTEDIESVSKKLGISRGKIYKARQNDTGIENFTFERMKVAELHFEICKKLKEYLPPKNEIENETD